MRKSLLALPILLSLSACGYRPVATDGLVDGNRVNVVLFANTSYRSGVEGVLAREMVSELARRTGGKEISGDDAPLVLSGTVLSYETVPVSYTAADTIREYRSILKVQAVLREKKTQKVLWKEDLTENQSYPTNAVNIAFQQNAEDAAIEKICRRLSEDVWRKISERF